MQSVDLRVDVLPVQEAAEKTQNTKKAEAEPIRNGDSFRAILEKIIAGATESGAGSAEQVEAEAGTEAGFYFNNTLEEEASEEQSPENQVFQDGENPVISLNQSSDSDEKNAAKKYAGSGKEQTVRQLPVPDDVEPKEPETVKAEADKGFAGYIRTDLKSSREKTQGTKNPVLVSEAAEKKELKNEAKKEKKSSEKILKKKKAGFAFIALPQTVQKKSVQAASKTAESAYAAGNEAGIKAAKPKKSTSEKPVFVVEDFRSSVPQDSSSGVYEAGAESRVETSSSEMSADFKNVSYSSQPAESGAVFEGNAANEVPSSNFSELLAQEIKNNAQDFVQAGKIVLRDNNAGEIKLQLYPENLGSVKIQLKMSGDKKLNGEIVVSSKEAFEAFSEGMSGLVASFKDSGFDTSDFNLSWSGRDKEDGESGNFKSGEYFSAEKSAAVINHSSVFAEHIYGYGRAENVNVIA